MPTIQMNDILPKWKPIATISHKNLTLIPLREKTARQRFRDYLLASEAIDQRLLEVTEVDQSGSVPELMAINNAKTPILLVDGEELQGAKQNRILNTSILLLPKSKTRIPVSCVEEGRWSHVSDQFESGNYAPSSLRQQKSMDVQASLRECGRAESDQGVVWDRVREHIEICDADTDTGAMSDAMETRGDVLERYRQALPYPDEACGVVAAVRGRFLAIDAFDSPLTLEAIWPRLVASYAVDAEASCKLSGKKKPFSSKAAEVLQEHISEQNCDAFASVGFGHDLRFATSKLLGQGLQAEDQLLHLSVFPASLDNPGRAHAGPRIIPPSQRRR